MEDYEDTTQPSTTFEDEVDESPEEKGVEEIEVHGVAPVEDPGAPGERVADRQLTPHFKLSEFRCKDGTPVPDHTVDGLIKLCERVLEPLRNKFGVCTVNSGFRSKTHNAFVGGASRSYHRYDLRPGFAAADVRFRNGVPRDWFAEADRILGNAGGAGRYNSFLHADNREGRWRQP
ncbi:MAG: D-Ala-D-Ala carboxypeptidase family metallohydrolase [Actinomycetota bacterium]